MKQPRPEEFLMKILTINKALPKTSFILNETKGPQVGYFTAQEKKQQQKSKKGII
jgi:hypothetical protein